MRQRYWRRDGGPHEHLRNWIRFDARANDGLDNFELAWAEASADWQNRSLDPCCQVFVGRERLRPLTTSLLGGWRFRTFTPVLDAHDASGDR